MATQFSSRHNFAANFQNRLNGITDSTMRDRLLLLLMMSRGRIKPSDGGEFLEWNVYMRNPKPRPYSGEGTPEYNDPDSLRTPRLGWASYHFGLRLNRHKLQTNKGKTQVVNLLTKTIEEVENSFKNRWPELFYQNGDSPNQVGDTKPMYGFYSWFGKYINSSAAASQGYQGKVRLVSGDYADITMDLGDESSDWQGDDGASTVQVTDAATGVTAGEAWWPAGRGDPAYDFWHPLIVNSTTAKWGVNPGFNTTYATEILDFALLYAQRVGAGDGGRINLLLCGTETMQVMRNKYQNTYRTMAEIIASDPMGGGTGIQTGSGRAFGQPIYDYAGCYLAQDFDIPYRQHILGVNIEGLEYQPCHPYDESASSRVPVMEPYTGDYPGGGGKMFGGFTLGQFRTQTPRGQFLIANLGD